MADEYTINSKLAAKKKFEDLLNRLPKSEQDKIFEAQSLEEIAKIAGISPDEAIEIQKGLTEYLHPEEVINNPPEINEKVEAPEPHLEAAKENQQFDHLYLEGYQGEKTEQIKPLESKPVPNKLSMPTNPPNILKNKNEVNTIRGMTKPRSLHFTRPSLSSAKKRLKNGLDALDAINKIIALSSKLSAAISSLISGITTIASAVFSAIMGFVSGIVTAIATVGSIIGVSLPVLGAIIIVVLMIVVFLLAIFGSPGSDDAPPSSPYQGISYSITCPTESVPLEGTATCNIILIYDSTQATCVLDNLSLVDDLPGNTRLVQGPNLTTGNYEYINSSVGERVTWKLSSNLTQPATDEIQNFNFKISITSSDNNTAYNQISLLGCD